MESGPIKQFHMVHKAESIKNGTVSRSPSPPISRVHYSISTQSSNENERRAETEGDRDRRICSTLRGDAKEPET